MEVEPMAGPAQTPTESTSNIDPNKKYRKCSSCGHMKELKSPWQELWRMPTMNEWLILIMLIGIMFIAWAYKHDVQVCRDFIANGSNMLNYSFGQQPDYSLDGINFSACNNQSGNWSGLTTPSECESIQWKKTYPSGLPENITIIINNSINTTVNINVSDNITK
jgi:hypothetical protein